MKILNIHGYKGSAHNSAYDALLSLGYEVISPQIDYDCILPNQLLSELTEVYENNNCSAVAGTSAGGFFAAQLCVREKCPSVFINPCFLPFIYLPRLGYNNIKGIKEYSLMFSDIIKIDTALTVAVVGENDEVIDCHDFTKALLGGGYYYSIPGGRHSGYTLPLKEIFSENKL